MNITVLVDESSLNNLTALTNDLVGRGFVLNESMAEIGVLTGSAPAAAIPGLASLPGVAAVEEEREDYHTQ